MSDPFWPDEIAAVRSTTWRRHEAERDVRSAISDQRIAIRAARQAGYSTTEIATHARLSRQRVNLATKG